MKTTIYIVITSVLSCCSPIKNNNKHIETAKSIEHIKSSCPENGICIFEVLENQKITISKDGIGQLYPKITDGNTTVYKFTYTKNKDERYQDSHYNEEIYFELPKQLDELVLKNENLSSVKLVFARLCFCRGQTGYYPINQGKLTITKLKTDMYKISLSFKTDEVPQVITFIEEIINLK